MACLPDCGGEPYDKETEICCDDVKYEKGPHDKCCGGTIIDTRVSACRLGFIFHNRRKGTLIIRVINLSSFVKY